MNQYFKRQKLRHVSDPLGSILREYLKVLHWNYLRCFVCVVGVWQREIWTCGVCFWCGELRTTVVGSVKFGPVVCVSGAAS